MNQWNMSLARPADRQTPSSTREKTVCTSSLATHADHDEVLLLSRLVSQLKLASEEDSRVRLVRCSMVLTTLLEGAYWASCNRWSYMACISRAFGVSQVHTRLDAKMTMT